MAHKFKPIFAGNFQSGTPSSIRRPFTHGSPFQGSPKSEDGDDSFQQSIEGRAFNGNNVNQSSPAAGTPQTYRQPGGKPVTFKKISANLDEEDTIIKQMKDAGYHDDKVVQHLIDQGLTVYNPKTISTRYAKIVKADRERLDEQLDDELTDWHEGDDAILKEAITRNQAKLDKAIEAAKDMFYAEVSHTMHARQKQDKRKVAFSKKACRNREERLKDGTALPELELDPNFEERMALREQRFVEIQQTKERKEAERQKRLADEQAKREAAARSVQDKEGRRREREAAAEAKRQANMSDKAKGDALADLLRMVNYAKQDPETQAQNQAKKLEIIESTIQSDMNFRRQQEDEMFSKISKEEKEDRDQDRRKRENEYKRKLARRIQRNNNAENDYGALVMQDLARYVRFKGPSEAAIVEPDELETVSADLPRRFFKRLNILDNTDSEDDEMYKVGGRRLNTSSILEQQEYSWFQERNPRGKLSIKALRNICALRNMEEAGEKKHLVFNLARADEQSSLPELRKILKMRQLSSAGTKTQMMNRLALDDAGKLVGGSDFYITMVEPRRHRMRTFGSLTPEGEDSKTVYRNGKRVNAIVLDSEDDSDDEEEKSDDDEQDGMDVDREEHGQNDPVVKTVEDGDGEEEL